MDRTCIGCRRKAPAAELVRVRVGPEGTLVIGPGPGRGAWLCAGSLSCLDLAVKRKGFERAFKGLVGLGDVGALRAQVAERARIEG